MWSIWNAPSDRDYLNQFAGEPEPEEEEIDESDVMQGPDAPPTMEQIRNQEGM